MADQTARIDRPDPRDWRRELLPTMPRQREFRSVRGRELAAWATAITTAETFAAWQAAHRGTDPLAPPTEPSPPALTAWQAEADRRWPDAMDMVEPAIGDGQWATLSWCGPLAVHLHRTRETAERALARIASSGCGHECWGDHELVDLAEPEAIDPAAEWLRGPRRAAHARQCWECGSFASGKMPTAALDRAWARSHS